MTQAAHRIDAPGASGFVFACTLEELRGKGKLVVRGEHLPILLVYDRGRVAALDNRCPHMGFPLSKGSIEDGILTCHWHYARFDLASGCTFDLWADDVPRHEVEVRDDGVWVDPQASQGDPVPHLKRRLEDGMTHDISLVMAKSVHGLLAAGTLPVDIIRQAALFGARNRDGWGIGLTILTALARLVPQLPEEETYLALFHGVRRVAADCAGEPPRRERTPLASAPDLETLGGWLRSWTAVRHRDGAERTVLTAIAAGASPGELARLLVTAATDRPYADGGHSLDFINKALECVDLIGWEHAQAVLPAVVGQMVAARSAEEETAWRQPVDLVRLAAETFDEVPALFAAAPTKRGWQAHAELTASLLADDPASVLGALKVAIRTGATPADLGRSLAYAAALRVARFGTANEHGDWETAHHAFTYCNAIHQALKRMDWSPGADYAPVRGVFHGAMAVYLARYLNVPPARLPGESGNPLDGLPDRPDELRTALLDAFDRQRQVDEAGRLVTRYLGLGHSSDVLIATLAHALLREDAGFHAYQMVEAGVRQFKDWGGGREGSHILIAAARYLAAHSPTERAVFQTADIAQRLMRGRTLHQEAEV